MADACERGKYLEKAWQGMAANKQLLLSELLGVWDTYIFIYTHCLHLQACSPGATVSGGL